MKILITGGSGLFAINFAIMMRDKYSVVLGLHSRDISLNGIETLKIDLESQDNLKHVLDIVKPQVVIHTAGLTNVEKCESDENLATHINVVLAENVARACFDKGITLVHISTDHLFTGEFSLVNESYFVKSINVYGRTKAEAELRVLEAYPNALIVRTNFYGWGTSYRHSFSDLIIKALRNNKKVTLFNDVYYTPILVEVATQAIDDLVKLKVSGIFHVVSDERISKYEFGMKLAKQFNLNSDLIIPGSISSNLSLVKRPQDMSLANNKICTLLGRKMGNADEHVERLFQQEQNGLALELQKL